MEIFSVCFEKILFVSVVLIPVRNTEINRKNVFLVLRNKPKNNRNRLSFGLFRFEPKKKFDCFEDTLHKIPVPRILECRKRIYNAIQLVIDFYKARCRHYTRILRHATNDSVPAPFEIISMISIALSKLR